MLIDSHCHLDFPELAGDEAGVLARARTAGVAGMLTIGTGSTSSSVCGPSPSATTMSGARSAFIRTRRRRRGSARPTG